ncbi:asparaginase [Candidatus Saccharibacteria bacterium]|nr:asparaginase [Candidatus Saccharibacteria bacterium]
MSQTIHFIITGGTIDSYYDTLSDTARPNKTSVIPDFVKSLKLYEKTEFSVVCMKDSRELTEKDVDNTLKEIEKSPNKQIIVTHGTYTMPDTARFLKANLERKDQTIVLTGSMIPINGFSPSDGPFSIGYALSQVQNLKPGVYVCMNGRTFDPEEVSKLVSEGRFVSIFQK